MYVVIFKVNGETDMVTTLKQNKVWKLDDGDEVVSIFALDPFI